MTDSRMALGMDRLPWLPDEPVRQARTPTQSRSGGGLLGWALAAVLVVAGGSYWLGTRSVEQPGTERGPAAQPSASLPLPQPTRAAPEAVQPVTSPELRPVPEPEVRRVTERAPAVVRPSWRPLPRTVPNEVAERVQRTIATEERDRVAGAQSGALAQPAPPHPAVVPPVNTQTVRLWPARESAGAVGRVVQIGAFGTRLQAKLGWRHMARAYPGVKRLPAVVVETRNTRGRPFYRFQIGTTSQAHSEVLCQRMERIRFSCAVVGLPGAKRAVER